MEQNLVEEVSIGCEQFSFALCRKTEQMGPVAIDHWWMPVTDLYGQRARRGSGNNFEAVTGCFWALCRAGQTTGDPGVQESYILARLVPHVRSQGSRRIFADAHLWSGRPTDRRRKDEAGHALDHMIQSSRDRAMTRLEFQRQTGDVLGPPPLNAAAIAAYQEFVPKLLGSACARLSESEETAIQDAVDQWNGLMKSIGRRGGRELQKQILDILSYEARAALHRAYSAVWCLLLPHLARRHNLTQESFTFLSLWHLDQVSEAAEGNSCYFHLFHGHVFGLHPASGAFLRTAAGRELMGCWLQNPESAEAFGRVLHGIYIAVHDYAEQRETTSLGRKKQPGSWAGTQMVELEEQSEQRRRGRRRPRGRRRDAD